MGRLVRRYIRAYNLTVANELAVKELDVDGPVDIYCVAGQNLNVEKEGGINENYWAARFKATSTDSLALVDKWMAGVVAEAAFTEGSISGGTSRFSCVHAYMELGAAITEGVSAIFTGQLAPGTTQTVDAGIEFIPGGKTIDRMISLRGNTINYVLGFTEAITNVVDATETGETGSKAGYLKIRIGDNDRYIRLYDAGN